MSRVGLKPLARIDAPLSPGPRAAMRRSAGSAISGANTSADSVDEPAMVPSSGP